MASEDLMPENATNPVGGTDYRTVPVEPDDKIIRAMCVAIENTDTDVEEENLRDGYDCWRPVAFAAWSAALSASPAPAGDLVEREAFQDRVLLWLIECFGAEIAGDRVERCDRFIEEALELAQSLGWTADRAHALVDYVFGRPAGESHQEVGGVMVTLAALCQAAGLDMVKGGNDELARIMQPEIVAKIRAKQAAKPTGSARPVAQSARALIAAMQPGWRDTHPTGEAVTDAFIAGFLHGIGREPWDDMHDYAAVCAVAYRKGELEQPLPAPPGVGS